MREIIVLSNINNVDGSMNMSYVYWLTVPLANQIAAPGFVSAVPTPTTPETTALQSGAVLEQKLSSYMSPGTAIGDIGTYLTSRYIQAQQVVTAQAAGKNYSGTYWDGTNWFNVPV